MVFARERDTQKKRRLALSSGRALGEVSGIYIYIYTRTLHISK